MSAAPDRQGDDIALDAFRMPGPELWPIVERVLRMPEHRHLVDDDCAIDWLMRAEGKIKHGNAVLGTCYMPRVNGELSKLFDWMLERTLGRMPNFLIILDAEYWTEATPIQREILVFHELMHADRARDADGEPRCNAITGEPLWAIRGHDIEQFNAVVARYGADDVHGVAEFIEAARMGDAAKGLRRIR